MACFVGAIWTIVSISEAGIPLGCIVSKLDTSKVKLVCKEICEKIIIGLNIRILYAYFIDDYPKSRILSVSVTNTQIPIHCLDSTIV